MKNLSLSLARSLNSYALRVLSADSTDSPIELYISPRLAYAIANLGSISMARLRNGTPAASPPERENFSPAL